MKRVADIPVSTRTSFIGDPQRAAEQVVARYEASESADAARKDKLHILHDSSRTLASLLNCKSNSAL